eukprot:4486812-Amphidinium_carterae.1
MSLASNVDPADANGPNCAVTIDKDTTKTIFQMRSANPPWWAYQMEVIQALLSLRDLAKLGSMVLMIGLAR